MKVVLVFEGLGAVELADEGICVEGRVASIGGVGKAGAVQQVYRFVRGRVEASQPREGAHAQYATRDRAEEITRREGGDVLVEGEEGEEADEVAELEELLARPLQ